MLLAPPWPAAPDGTVSAAVAAAVARRAGAAPHPFRTARPVPRIERSAAGRERRAATAAGPPGRAARRGPHAIAAAPFLASFPAREVQRPDIAVAAAVPGLAPRPAPLPARPGPSGASRRWSLSAWSFIRGGEGSPLADRGLLGASQAGARLGYRLNRDPARPLALSARLSFPLKRPAGAEAALGIDWKPARRLPVHVLAERRQALGREGRSAFAVTLHGGVSDSRLGPFRIDSYAQAGMVGARSLDPFAEGSLRLSLAPGGRARFGAGVWGSAQPGLARLDLGPQAALRLPVAGRSLTLAADWRVRVAGNAGPGSGPTLTLATDF